LAASGHNLALSIELQAISPQLFHPLRARAAHHTPTVFCGKVMDLKRDAGIRSTERMPSGFPTSSSFYREPHTDLQAPNLAQSG
jgi:hypothetical protein